MCCYPGSGKHDRYPQIMAKEMVMRIASWQAPETHDVLLIIEVYVMCTIRHLAGIQTTLQTLHTGILYRCNG